MRLCYAFRVSRGNFHPQRKRRFVVRRVCRSAGLGGGGSLSSCNGAAARADQFALLGGEGVPYKTFEFMVGTKRKTCVEPKARVKYTRYLDVVTSLACPRSQSFFKTGLAVFEKHKTGPEAVPRSWECYKMTHIEANSLNIWLRYEFVYKFSSTNQPYSTPLMHEIWFERWMK